MRLLSVVGAILGTGYILMPFQAMRPDGLLAAHPTMWGMVALHPLVGVAFLFCSGRIWLHYDRRLLFAFWTLIGIAVLGGPITLSLVVHYGK